MRRERPPLILTRERAEKFHDEVYVRARQISSQLGARHDVDGLCERSGGAIVEIRRRDGDVAEARHTEHVPIAVDAGDRVTPEVGIADVGPLREWVVEDPESLQQIAAEIPALMASDAAVGFEQLVSLFLFGSKGIAVPLEVTVETRIRRDQGTLEGGQRVQHVRPLGTSPV